MTLYYRDPAPEAEPPVVLLHGLGSTSASWQAQMAALRAARFRPIAVDLPGFGRSPYDGQWSPRHAAEKVQALLAQLGAVPAHVVGISLGGTVALSMALAAPEAVRSLTLVNTFAVLRPAGLRGWAYFALRMVVVHTLGLEAQGKAVVRRIFPRPEHAHLRAALLDEIRQADPRAYRAAMRSLVRFDVADRLHTLTMPVLVVTGADDTTIPPATQAEMTRRIPHARHEVIPHAGHAVIADSPEAFNRTLLDFLHTLPQP